MTGAQLESVVDEAALITGRVVEHPSASQRQQPDQRADQARAQALLALPTRPGWRLRPGRQVRTSLYACTADDLDGVPVGHMATVWLAALVCDATATRRLKATVPSGGL